MSRKRTRGKSTGNVCAIVRVKWIALSGKPTTNTNGSIMDDSQQILSLDQEDFEQAARAIVMDTKNYPNFRPYMADLCPEVRVCDSCMCPLDGRLNAKEVGDAIFACKLSVAEQDRQEKPVRASPNVVQAEIYAPRPCECGAPRRPRHKYCDRCAVQKKRERDRQKKRRKRGG